MGFFENFFKSTGRRFSGKDDEVRQYSDFGTPQSNIYCFSCFALIHPNERYCQHCGANPARKNRENRHLKQARERRMYGAETIILLAWAAIVAWQNQIQISEVLSKAIRGIFGGSPDYIIQSFIQQMVDSIFRSFFINN
jgi:hypothetical protein